MKQTNALLRDRNQRRMRRNKSFLTDGYKRTRNLGGLIFIQLRDRSGIVQVVADSTLLDEATFQASRKLAK